jgi:hypothetical protein
LDGTGAADRPCRAVKGRKETVSGRVDFPAPKTFQFTAYEAVMMFEELLPLAISKFDSTLRRADYIREQYRGEHPIKLRTVTDACKKLLDLIENSIRITGPRKVILAGEFNVFRTLDMLGHVASTAHSGDPVT